jgi:hypothetical protein
VVASVVGAEFHRDTPGGSRDGFRLRTSGDPHYACGDLLTWARTLSFVRKRCYQALL